ncbi:MAG TPA: IPT/TIG domain-containing protein, partial [Bryobacteraceae bacterium]
MRKQLYLAAALSVVFSWVLPAQSTILFETTTPPDSGQPSGGVISSTQYVGNYFVLTTPAQVTGISTAASVSDGGSIFGAILSVPNLSSLPAGNPFGASGAAAPLATAILQPTSTNGIVSAPVSVNLAAGVYVVVFGTGQFGAGSGTANLMVSDGNHVTLPSGSNQVNYGPSCNGGTTACWSNGFGAVSPFYFAVTGNNGLPGITTLNPNFAAPGGPNFTLTVNGSNFQNTSNVAWNGTSLSTTYSSSTQLTAQVPSNLISTAGTAQVTVTTGGLTSTSFPFTIGASSGPTITSLNPSSVLPNAQGFILTVNGSGFASGAIIEWGNLNLITDFTSSTQLTAQVTPGLLSTAQAVTITVVNPNQVVSNAMTFTVGQVSNIPTLTSLSPTSTLAGGSSFTLTLNGTNFNANSAVSWNSTLLPTTFVNATQLTASVTNTLIAAASTASVSVTNAGAGTSNIITFPVLTANGPAITSLSPSSTAPGSATFTLTINGTNFTNSSAVLWNGSLLPTTYLSPSQLTATVNSGLVLSAGTSTVTVTNPGNITSNATNFSISATPPPVVSSLSPSSTAPGGPQFTLTVNGLNFTQNSAVLWNGSLLATTFVSATQLTATVSSNLIANAGTANVTVSAPTTGTSNAMSFTIAVATGPVISSLSPAAASPGGSSFIMTVNGTGFSATSTVNWNGSPLVTVFGSSTQLQASVSSNLIASAGSANITVVTGSTASNAITFTVGTPNTPVLSSLSPGSATVGGPQFALTVNGSNFANGATVAWNGGLLPTTFVSATQLTATVGSNLIGTTGTANITVINPSGTNATSNVLNFTISSAASPTISTLSPASATAGAAAFTLTVNGQGFLNGAVIRWNGSALSSTNFVSATQLTGTVPANLVASQGSANVTVANPGGAISNSLLFTITASSNSTTIFQTTLPPTPGQPGSSSLASFQFLGNYFVLTAPTHIDSIGTYAQASDGGTIFGAIISVPNLQSAPSGSPFDSSTLVTATLHPGTTSAIVTAPVSADLPAGTYVIVFGSGYYGATSTQALAAYSNGGAANVPAGWNQVSWGQYCGQGFNISCWAANFAAPSQFYFLVTGTSSVAPSLSITTLSPTGTTAGGSSFSLTVNGTGFTNSSTVQWNGFSLATTYVSATQLTAAVPANLISSTGGASVTVLNASGSISNAVTFTISSLSLSITSLSPTSATAGGPAFTLTVNGSGFSNGATLYWNGSPVSTTFVSATQLTASIPANLIQTASNPGASLAVLSSGGVFSNTISFAVNTATPAITTLSPASVTVGSQGLTLQVNGSGYLSNSTVLWNGTPLPTTYVSPTQLTATLSANLLSAAGSEQITVQNPNGSVSASSPFLVNAVGSGSSTGGLAHFAVGSNFTTGITIINTGATTAQYRITFYDDNGNPINLPFSTGTTNQLSGTLSPYGSLYIEATNPNGPLTSGWGQISADSSIVIQSLFRSTLNNTHYEASVPSSSGS